MTSEELLVANAALSGEVQLSQEALKIALLAVEKLKVEAAYLRRMKYGRSSEQLGHAQLDLVGGQLTQPEGLTTPTASSIPTSRPSTRPARSARRNSVPACGICRHICRRTVVHTPNSGCDCDACGRSLREIGQDVSEVLDYEPDTFHVVRHVRLKLACATCSTITQAPARAAPSTAAWPAPACSRMCW